MLVELETGIGLDVVLSLQANGNDLLDILASLLNAMGGDIFFLIVLSLVYWSLNRQLGVRLLFALAVVGIVNTVLKETFQRPRPFQVSDAVIPLFESGGFGIPSGHVMVALVVWGYGAWYLKNRLTALGVGIFVVMMMWSRMYAGVHFPQDVIAGVLFGLITLVIYIPLAERFAERWSQVARAIRMGSILVLSAGATLLLSTNNDGLAVIGILVGTIIGLELAAPPLQFDTSGPPGKRIVRYLVGLIFIIVVFFGLRVLFAAIATEGTALSVILRVLRYGLVATTAIYLYPLAAIQLGLMTSPEESDETG